MVDQFFSLPAVIRRLHVGPLGPYLDDFAALLSEQGYTRSTVRSKIELVADFSRWLDHRKLGLEELGDAVADKFLKHRRRHKSLHRGHAFTVQVLLGHLRNAGAICVPPAEDKKETEVDRIVSGFERYLMKERGLSRATLLNYLPYAERFLCERFGDGAAELEELGPSDISAFILRYAKTQSPGRAKLMVTALRSLFRFLRMSGRIETDLAACVPTVANWRMSTVPKSIRPEEVERLLESCDQTSATGQRNYAILLILARLGLRAGEIVAMTLDDINWEAGELTVRSKGGRQHRLPLPHAVGEALVRYIRDVRPRCSTRKVFIRMKAPLRGFAGSIAICSIVSRALDHAGLHPPCKGAHLLRHSLATRMLCNGGSLTEIGEVLGHRLPNTTEIYAKVDLTALRRIARSWLGGQT